MGHRPRTPLALRHRGHRRPDGLDLSHHGLCAGLLFALRRPANRRAPMGRKCLPLGNRCPSREQPTGKPMNPIFETSGQICQCGRVTKGRSRTGCVLLPLMLLLAGCASVQPKPGGTEAVVEQWLAAPYAPTFTVRDTESSLGPYDPHTKSITLRDLVKFHGHPCDGLVTAACALKVGLQELYPEGVVDRTDTGGISNNSPCFGDAVAFVTGARIRFGTQKIDPSLGNEFILYRFSTGKAVKVALKPGLFPAEVAALEAKIRAGQFNEGEMRRCQRLQWEFARGLLERPWADSFSVTPLNGFVWKPDGYEHLGPRGDVINKHFGRPQERRPSP
ncbi:MAG: hypothetical protein D6766_11065 [Verrucomicrobia bacterium]|nr:MAG: hypothetical protein D6766_11065 [Verrucomicrobiota bacterium]